MIGYELLKLSGKKLLWLLLPALLLINGYLYVQQQMNVSRYLIENKEVYRQLENNYRMMKHQDALKESAVVIEELNSYSLLLSAATHPDMVKDIPGLLSSLGDDPELVRRFHESPYAEDGMLLYRDYILHQRIHSEYAAIMQYPQYLQGLRDNAASMLSVSIFREAGGFSNRNIVQTVEAFDGLDRLPLEIGPSAGITSATAFAVTDIAMMAVILLFGVYVLMLDREANVAGFIRTNKYGRFPVIIGKLATLCLATLALSLLFYGSVLLLAERLYGFGDMSRFVQSIGAFQQSHIPLTVGQYLGAYVLGKAMVCLLAAMLCGLFFIWFSHIVKAYLALAVFFAASSACYIFIHSQSPFNLLKYFNLVAFFDTFDLLARYRNLNMFGFPVNQLHASALGIALSLLLLPAVSAFVDAKRYPKQQPVLFLAALGNVIRNYITPLPPSIHLFAHEWFKSLFTAKGYIILLAALLLGFNQIQHEEVRYQAEDAQYLQYYRAVSGPLNEENSSYIETEQASFNRLGEEMLQLEDAYSRADISQAEYLQRKAELEMFAQQRKAFDRIYAQYIDLQELRRSKGIDGSFINEINAGYLFDRPTHELMSGALLMTLTVLFASAIFPIDVRRGMANILRSTLKGQTPLYVSKFAVGCCSAVIILVFLYIPLYINVFRYFDLEHWRAPVQSVKAFRQFPLRISIREFVLLSHMLQCAGMLMAVQVVFFFSQLAKRQSLALLLNSAILVGPFVMQLAGLHAIGRLSFNHAFFPFAMYANKSDIGGTTIYYSCLFIVGVAAALLSWRRFIHHTESGRGRWFDIIHSARKQELR